MAADVLPGVDEYAQRLDRARRRYRVHRVCAVCYPKEPKVGDLAVCGAFILGEPPRAYDVECAACLKAWPWHTLKHLCKGQGWK